MEYNLEQMCILGRHLLQLPNNRKEKQNKKWTLFFFFSNHEGVQFVSARSTVLTSNQRVIWGNLIYTHIGVDTLTT